MKPISFKLWIRMGTLPPLLFLLIFAGIFFPDSQVMQILFLLSLATLVPMCLIGAVMGVMLTFRRLRFKCPYCSAPSSCTGGDRKSVYIDCPSCGTIRGIYSRFPPLTYRIEKVPTDPDDCQLPPQERPSRIPEDRTLTVHYRYRNWSTIVGSVFLLLFSALLTAPSFNTDFKTVPGGVIVVACVVQLLALVMFGFACKLLYMFVTDKKDALVFDETGIGCRGSRIQWADVQSVEPTGNGRGQCISLDIFWGADPERPRKLTIPMSPGLSDAEIDKVLRLLSDVLRRQP